MQQVWLVDVDGTVLNKDALWRQLEQIFHTTFPDLNINFREYYNEHRGKEHSVGAVIDAMTRDFHIDGEQFLAMFRKVDYNQCFDSEGWQRLTQQAKEAGAVLAFFTEGYVPVQEIKREKLQELVGSEISWHIFGPGQKMDCLRDLKTQYERENMDVSRLIDDSPENRRRAEMEHGLSSAERL